MKNKLLYIILSGMFFVASPVFAADVCVSGAGDTFLNGTYIDQGNGYWYMGSYELEQDNVIQSHIYPELRDTLPIPPGGYTGYWYNSQSIGTGGTIFGIASNNGGTAPAPTITSGACGGGGGGGTTETAATSSINQVQQNMSTGFYMYLLVMGGTIWFFRKRSS